MCIAVDCDPQQRHVPESGPAGAATTLAALKAAPPGTVVMWDDDAGQSFFGVKGAEIAGQGYTLLRHDTFNLPGLIGRWWPGGVLPVRLRWWSPPYRSLDLWLYYKPGGPQSAQAAELQTGQRE
jgi:hypothetical protein